MFLLFTEEFVISTTIKLALNNVYTIKCVNNNIKNVISKGFILNNIFINVLFLD